MGMEFLCLDCTIVDVLVVKLCYSFTGHHPQNPPCILCIYN